MVVDAISYIASIFNVRLVCKQQISIGFVCLFFTTFFFVTDVVYTVAPLI